MTDYETTGQRLWREAGDEACEEEIDARDDVVDQFLNLTLAEFRKIMEERDELLVQKRVLLDAIDSWKAMNTQGRAERDSARDLARRYHIRLRSQPDMPPSAYDGFCKRAVEEDPWLEETE